MYRTTFLLLPTYIPFMRLLFLLFVLAASTHLAAQSIDDIHYSVTDQGHIHLYYRVMGKTTSTQLQLRIAYSYTPARGSKQWYTLKREELTPQNGEVFWAGNVELATLQNFIETAEIQFELLSDGKIIEQKYFRNLLDGAYESEPAVFVPVVTVKEVIKNTPEEPLRNLNEVRSGNARMSGGVGIRGLTDRRITHRCEELAHLTFENEGVAWFYLTVTESGKVTSAIYTVRTTTGEESNIDNMEQRNFARACVKCYQFASARGQGLQYGFVPVYFKNK